jgi:hypothetical protein
MVAYLKKVALLAALLLIAVGSYAAYTNYKESKITESKLMTFGAGQTKAWILANPSETAALMTDSNASIHVTQEELVRYPTLKAYMNYVDSSSGTPSLNSMSIDPLEARSLLFFISQRSDVKPQPYNSTGEWYLFLIETSGRYYGINTVFSNVKPSLNSGVVGIASTSNITLQGQIDTLTTVNLNSPYHPPVSQLQALTIALRYGGWTKDTLSGMKVIANLELLVSSADGGTYFYVANQTVTDYSQKTINGTTYRYAWEVSVYGPPYVSIPSPGYYFVDAVTGEIIPFLFL